MNNEKKITIFLPNLLGGGAEKVMLNLAGGLLDQGYEIDLVLSNAEGDYINDVDKRITIVNLHSKRTSRSLFPLVKYILRYKPFVIISSLDHANVVAIVANKICSSKTKIIATVHANTQPLYENKKTVFQKIKHSGVDIIYKKIYPYADEIVAVSNGVKQFYSKKIVKKGKKITVLYNPVLTPSVFEKAKEPLDHPWFGPGSVPVIVAVGRLSSQKNFKDAIKAFCEVRKTTEARLLILGEGEDRKMLEKLIDSTRFKEDILLPGFVNNPYKYIARSSVFLLSSIYEGLPTVLIEALGLKVPVVTTDCPSGPSEIVTADTPGWIVPVGDIGGLAKGIIAALKFNTKEKSFSSLKRFELKHAVQNYIDFIYHPMQKTDR